MQKKGYEAALRKFTFPHVSVALSGVSRRARQASRAGSHCGRRLALPAPLGPLPAPLGPLPGPGVSEGSCHSAGEGVEVGKLVLLVLLGLHLWAPIPRDPVLPLPHPGASGTPGHFGFGPALSARLRGSCQSAHFCMQRRLVSCARKARLLLFQFSQHLELWRLGSTDETGESQGPALRCKPCGRACAACRVSGMSCPAAWAAEGWFSPGPFFPTALRWHDGHGQGCVSQRGVCLGTGCTAGVRLRFCFQWSRARPWGVQPRGRLRRYLGSPPLGSPAARQDPCGFPTFTEAPCGFLSSQERMARSFPCAACPSTSCSSRAR